MTSAEIVTTERLGRITGEPYTRSEIVMGFVATDTYGAHTSTISLSSDLNISI